MSKSIDIEINEAIRSRHGSDWSWESGVLNDYDLWIPIAGEGTLESDGVVHEARKGKCFLLQKGKSYSARQTAGSMLRVLGIHFDFRNASGRLYIPDHTPFFTLEFINVDFVIELAERTVDAWRRDAPHRRNRKALQVWGRALFEELTAQNRMRGESAVAKGQRIQIERICRDASGLAFGHRSIEYFASQMGLSRWQFCRVFKRHVGMTPQNYVLRSRVRNAEHMLETSTLTAKEIATRLGYTDASHFAKHFKKHTGMTPSQYRKRKS